MSEESQSQERPRRRPRWNMYEELEEETIKEIQRSPSTKIVTQLKRYNVKYRDGREEGPFMKIDIRMWVKTRRSGGNYFRTRKGIAVTYDELKQVYEAVTLFLRSRGLI